MKTETVKKNMLWNAAGNIVYLLSQWVITVLVTVLGGFEDAGILSVAMSVTATFQTIAMFGIRSFQVSDLKEKYTDTCYVGLRSLTCVLAMFLCMLTSLFGGYSGKQLLAVFLFMAFRLVEDYSDVLHGIAQKNDRLDIAGKSFFMKGIGILVCFLAGYALTKQLSVGLLLMMLFSLASTLFYDFPSVRKLSDFRLFDTLSHCARLARETLPLCIYLFLFTALTTVPRLILEKQCGEVILGAYASIYAPATLLQSATGYLYNPFAPAFAAHRQAGEERRFDRLFFRIVLVIFIISAVVMIAAQFLGEFALVLVFKEQIREYVYLLNPILIVNFLSSCFGFFCMVAVVLRKFKLLLISVSVGFVSTTVLAWVLIGACGVNGTSYGLIAALILSCVILGSGILFRKKSEGSVSEQA